MSEVRLHAAGVDGFFADAAVAARKIDAGDLREQAADIAFESMDLLLKVLTPNRWRLLKALKASGPSSIRQLAITLTRDHRGVHADVAALIEAVLVEKTPEGAVRVPWSRITAEMAITQAA